MATAETTPTASPHPSFMFAMGELSGQVAALREELKYQREDRERESKAMRDRLDTLEEWRYWTIGFAAGVTLLINVLAYIWSAFHG